MIEKIEKNIPFLNLDNDSFCSYFIFNQSLDNFLLFSDIFLMWNVKQEFKL